MTGPADPPGPSGPVPLEPDQSTRRAMLERVGDLLDEMLAGLGERPSSDIDDAAAAAAALPDAPPERGRDLEDLLELVEAAVRPTYETAGPGYLAYIPGGGLYAAALAEFLAAGLNRFTGIAQLAPACVALEQSVLEWLCELFGLPESSQALLTTGGSMANLVALVAARTRLASGALERAALYAGEHSHASVVKAARTAGLDPDMIRTVASTDELRMRPDSLRNRIEQDRAAGLVPVAAVAAGGTTNTGTIDPLPAIADVTDEAGVWLHVDAAYGGFFQLTARGAKRLAGIDRADSITVDPHKSLFLPYGTGAVLVRRGEDLARSFSEHADYLRDLGAGAGARSSSGRPLVDLNAVSPELSRDWRGLRLWLPLHLHGVDAFREQLDEKLDLTRLVHTELAGDPRFTVPWEPDLTVVAFRLADAGEEAQQALLDRINATQRVVLSSTTIDARTYLRVAILSHRTHRDRVEECLEIIRQAAEAVA